MIFLYHFDYPTSPSVPFSLSLALQFCPAIIYARAKCDFVVLWENPSGKISKYQNLKLTCGSLSVRAPGSPDIQQRETLASFLSVGKRFWRRLYLQRDKAAFRCGLSEELLPLSDDNQEHLV